MAGSGTPISVYLDSQDFSRFGDVLRGKASAPREIFEKLKAFRESGDVVFPVSMPHLGELFQYDEHFRETTFAKAEAIGEVCGKSALIFPTRLVALEVAQAAISLKIIRPRSLPPAINADRFWYPYLGNELASLKSKLTAELNQEIAAATLPNRKARRAAAKLAKTIDYATLIEQGSWELEDRLGLPPKVIKSSFGALLRGKISPDEASMRLFRAVCEPVTFAHLYFEKLENDRSLPTWISDAGAGFAKSFAQLRERIEPIIDLPEAKVLFKELIGTKKLEFSRLSLRFAEGDLTEFGLEQTVLERFKNDVNLTAKIPAARVMSNVIERYILQIAGITAKDAKIEQSFGGDLVHALYLPHVNIWRGDRRFSEVVRQGNPEFADRVVSKLADLPAVIERRLAANA